MAISRMTISYDDIEFDIEFEDEPAPAQEPEKRNPGVYRRPMEHAQRNALFGAFHNVFQTNDQEDRHGFSRAVLGPDAPTSWSADGISYDQADHLLDVLRFLEDGV